MSSIKFDPGPIGRAERQFREAFDRLKAGKPLRLPKGTKVSQNNVAREAGVDPSALRQARFPELVAEIRTWTTDNQAAPSQQSPRQKLLEQRSNNRDLRDKNKLMQVQRDDAMAKLVDAEARIVALVEENERLRARLPASAVTSLRPKGD